MSLKHSLGTFLQGFCHIPDSISDGFRITSANFSLTRLRYISHVTLAAVTLPRVIDETYGFITKTTCVTWWCVQHAMEGPSHYLSGSTGDLTATLWPEALGPPVPCNHLEISHSLTGGGMDDCDIGDIFFSFLFLFPFIWGQGFLTTIPEWWYGQATAGFAQRPTRMYSKNPALIIYSAGVTAAIASFNIVLFCWVLFHISAVWETDCQNLKEVSA